MQIEYYIAGSLKWIAPILISVAIMAASLTKSAIWVYYEMNKSYIVENVCENRFNPQSTCEGKCFLMEKLGLQESETKSPAPMPVEESAELFLFLDAVNDSASSVVNDEDEPTGDNYILRSGRDVIMDILRPPTARRVSL